MSVYPARYYQFKMSEVVVEAPADDGQHKHHELMHAEDVKRSAEILKGEDRALSMDDWRFINEVFMGAQIAMRERLGNNLGHFLMQLRLKETTMVTCFKGDHFDKSELKL